jgi:hypothetical protein
MEGPVTAISNAAIAPAAEHEVDTVKEITKNGKVFEARTASGFSFIVGSTTTFTDDMKRTGLFQGESSIKDSMKFGVYAAANYVQAFGPWAHLIEPTLTAEGGARFATVNAYDRAAFTFGAPQLAAHTPNANFIEYFRLLLALPDADKHFPDLSLRANAAGQMTVHVADGAGFKDLETVIEVTRPNGKKERQLALLMAYLNSSPTAVDDAELRAAARLMNWLRVDQKAKELQIKVFIDAAQAKLARAKKKIASFTGADWRIALWIMDIGHQGRGTLDDVAKALASAKPEAQLRLIGAPKYQTRIDTVGAAMDKLQTAGVLEGFKV